MSSALSANEREDLVRTALARIGGKFAEKPKWRDWNDEDYESVCVNPNYDTIKNVSDWNLEERVFHDLKRYWDQRYKEYDIDLQEEELFNEQKKEKRATSSVKKSGRPRGRPSMKMKKNSA